MHELSILWSPTYLCFVLVLLMSKNPLSNLMSWRLTHIFSFEFFYSFSPYIKDISLFWVNYYIWSEAGSPTWFFKHIPILLSQHCLCREDSFPQLNNLDTLFKNQLALKHVKYHVWNELPVQVRCTMRDAWGWCTGTTQGDEMGREEGGGFRMGNTCIPVADSFWYLAKLIQLCKV